MEIRKVQAALLMASGVTLLGVLVAALAAPALVPYALPALGLTTVAWVRVASRNSC